VKLEALESLVPENMAKQPSALATKKDKKEK
jgi:hypothetical protein